jgi:hypothetical protein
MQCELELKWKLLMDEWESETRDCRFAITFLR